MSHSELPGGHSLHTGKDVAMTEDRGRYDPRPPSAPGRHGDPQPLGDLLRQYVIDRDWTRLLDKPNGKPQRDRHDGGGRG